MHDAVKEVMSNILEIDPGQISPASSTETIDRWDSLKHMQLIMALEDEFDIQFPDEIIPELTSFTQIVTSLSDLKTP